MNRLGNPDTYVAQKGWPNPPDLTQPEIHVWKVSLDQPAVRIDQYRQYLRDDERARAGQFYAELHRSRFIIGKAMLRILLGGYLHVQPEFISFVHGEFGKPSIAVNQNPNDIRFNLTHSNNLALYAFSIGREIGIDLEWIHTIPDFDGVAARLFSSEEYRIWSELPDDEKEPAFYRCWTRKESFIKAIGNGFSFPLDQFEVAFRPGEIAKLLQVEKMPAASWHWFFHELPPIPGYAAAIISEEEDCRLTCFEFL